MIDTPFMGYLYPSQTPVKLSKVKLIIRVFTPPKLKKLLNIANHEETKLIQLSGMIITRVTDGMSEEIR